jgi:hypothetical protein
MSIWASRFGEEGVNLAVDNSFRLQITNASTSPFTLNLFNLGGSAATQTKIVTTFLTNPALYAGVTNLTNSVFTAPSTVLILDDLGNTISSVNMLAGQTLNDYYALANPITSSNGQVGTIFLEQLTSNDYNVYITAISNISKFGISPDASINIPAATIQTFVQSNPLITIRGPKNVNINYIQNSEIGNAYKVLGIDVYSDNTSQVLEPLNYFYRDANGDVQGMITAPTIDPYQTNKASLQMIYVNDFQIFTNTQFQYVINVLSSVYLTFNYVNFGVEDFKMFDKVFYQQVRDKFWMDKKLIQQSRVKSIHIQ